MNRRVWKIVTWGYRDTNVTILNWLMKFSSVFFYNLRRHSLTYVKSKTADDM